MYHSKWQNHLVVPLENFAGHDLLKIHSDNQEKGSEERKTLKAKVEAAKSPKSENFPPIISKEIVPPEKLVNGGSEAVEPIHEGITCDGCKVNRSPFVAGDQIEITTSFRAANPSLETDGSAPFAKTTIFVTTATPPRFTNMKCV